jgi:hypothetical protein
VLAIALIKSPSKWRSIYSAIAGLTKGTLSIAFSNVKFLNYSEKNQDLQSIQTQMMVGLPGSTTF